MHSRPKSKLRKILLNYRRLLDPVEYQVRNQNLMHQVLGFIETRNIRSVHTFLPIIRNNEFDIRPALPALWGRGIATFTSITDIEKKELRHYRITDQTKYLENELGIPEPTNAEKAEMSELEMILVPLLAGDRPGHRLGYGGGYYDRLLADFEGITVGVCLSTLFDNLGTDSWDVPVKHMLFYNGKNYS